MFNILEHSRLLTEHELTILFGMSGKTLSAVSFNTSEEYIQFLHSVYSGEDIAVPSTLPTSGFGLLYIYYSLPIGSRPLSQLHRNWGRCEQSSIIEHREFEGIPFIEACGQMAEFLGPSVKKMYQYFDGSDTEYELSFTSLVALANTQEIGSNSMSRSKVYDTLFSGLFALTYNGKIISVVSSNILTGFTEWQRQISTNTVFSTLLFGFKDSEVRLSSEEMTQLRVSWDRSSLRADILTAAWNTMTFAIAPGALRLGTLAMYSDGDSVEFVTNIPYVSSLYQISAQFVDSILSAERVAGQTSTVSSLSFSNTNRFYSRASGKIFIFENSDNPSSSQYSGEGAIKHVNFGSSFFSSLTEALADVRAASNPYDGVKSALMTSTTFSASLSEVQKNPRYEVITSEDNRFFFAIKTSKAREALKQAKITRLISISMENVVDVISNLILHTEFDFGFGKSSAIASPLYLSRDMYNALTPKREGVETTEQYIERWAQKASSQVNAAELTERVNNLYSSQLSMCPSSVLPAKSNYNSYYNKDTLRWTTTLHEYLIGNTACAHSSINANTLTLNFLAFMDKTFASSNNRFSWTQLQAEAKKCGSSVLQSLFNQQYNMDYLLHYYVANFVSDPAIVSTMTGIRSRPSYYCPREIRQLPLGMCLTIEPDSIALLKQTKKCKTFADYAAWFDTAVAYITPKIQGYDELDKIIWNYVVNYVTTTLTVLKTAEASLLPKQPAKQRQGRKRKTDDEDASQTDDTVEISEEAKDLQDSTETPDDNDSN